MITGKETIAIYPETKRFISSASVGMNMNKGTNKIVDVFAVILFSLFQHKMYRLIRRRVLTRIFCYHCFIQVEKCLTCIVFIVAKFKTLRLERKIFWIVIPIFSGTIRCTVISKVLFELFISFGPQKISFYPR